MEKYRIYRAVREACRIFGLSFQETNGVSRKIPFSMKWKWYPNLNIEIQKILGPANTDISNLAAHIVSLGEDPENSLFREEMKKLEINFSNLFESYTKKHALPHDIESTCTDVNCRFCSSIFVKSV